MIRAWISCLTVACALVMTTPVAVAQEPALSAELEAKIEAHANVRHLTNWGSRMDWSADSKRMLIVSKDYGDVFELELASGKIRPVTFHFPHKGFFRAFYLQNGDILLTGARDFDLDSPGGTRLFATEMWVLKGDLSGPPVALGMRNWEGVAVSRRGMQIAWATSGSNPIRSKPDREYFQDPSAFDRKNQIWTGDIDYASGNPQLKNQRLLVDCGDKNGPLGKIYALRNLRCAVIEPQNFVPPAESRLTFGVLAYPEDTESTLSDLSKSRVDSLILDLESGKISLQSQTGPYTEPEGVFPGGEYTTVEHFGGTLKWPLTENLDIWRLKLDGSGEMKRMTFYNDVASHIKADQAVVSPDGRWMAFSVVPGAGDQGLGIFLMDLTAAGFR